MATAVLRYVNSPIALASYGEAPLARFVFCPSVAVLCVHSIQCTHLVAPDSPA